MIFPAFKSYIDIFFTLSLLFTIAVVLSGCAPMPKGDPQASRINLINLPKFGIDSRWGGHSISPEYEQMRANTLSKLSGTQTTVEEFVLRVTQSGWEAMARDDYATAMRRFNQAWLLNRESPLAVMGMAMAVYERDSDTEGGLLLMGSLQQPLAEEPTYWLNYGSMYRRADRLAEALAAFERAHQLAPGQSKVMINLVRLYAQSGNFDAACRTLTEATTYQISIESTLKQYIEANVGEVCSVS